MPRRINVENAAIALGRKYEPYCDGYPLAEIQGWTDDLQVNDQTIDVFGSDNQITYQIVDGATVRVDSVADGSAVVLYDLTTGQKPQIDADSAEMRGYYPVADIKVNLLRNHKNENNDGYDEVEFWGAWSPILKVPTGGPKEHGRVQLDGRAQVPIRVIAAPGQKIIGMFDVVSLTPGVNSATGTVNLQTAAGVNGAIARIPAIVPLRAFESYALAVELHACDARTAEAHAAKVNNIKRLVVGAAMVAADGTVTISEEDAQEVGMTLLGAPAAGNRTIATHAFVTYILVPPAGNGAGRQNGRCLLGDPVQYKGRYD